MTTARNNVSVVIATKNRPYALASLLASIQCQTLPRFDLIIALNGTESWHYHLDKLTVALQSRDITPHIHKCLGMTFAELHEYLLHQAKTEYVCRVDDDHVLHPNYLQEIVSVMEHDLSAGAAGGIVLHPEVPGYDFSENDFEEALIRAQKQGVLNTILQLKKHPTNKLLKVPDLYSSFMVRKSVVKAVGGIATCYTACSYREETDLTLRMTLAGFNQYIVPAAIVWHVRADQGGERKSKRAWEALRARNEQLFQQRMRRWCNDPAKQFATLWETALAEIRSNQKG